MSKSFRLGRRERTGELWWLPIKRLNDVVGAWAVAVAAVGAVGAVGPSAAPVALVSFARINSIRRWLAATQWRRDVETWRLNGRSGRDEPKPKRPHRSSRSRQRCAEHHLEFQRTNTQLIKIHLIGPTILAA